MAENETIEAPDFDRIKKLDGSALRDAIQLLWFVANNEAAERRRGVRRAQETEERKVKSDAPTSQQNNYDVEDATIVMFTGSSAFNLTGIRNGTEGRTVVLHNLGSGTVTVKYESASSDATNRFDTATAADVSLPSGKTFVARYLNTRWRQQVQA